MVKLTLFHADQPYVPTLLERPVNSVLIYDVRVINVGWLLQSDLQSELHVQLKAHLPNDWSD